MLTLSRPLHTAATTFAACIGSIQDVKLKARLQSVSPVVAQASAAFDAAARQCLQHTIAQDSKVGEDVSIDEMVAVYDQKLVGQKSPARWIYDSLLSSAPHGKCPLCVQRPASTLDHYLPKRKYASLAVAPLNLVPSCTDCNKAKRAASPKTANDSALHPYFDEIDSQQWLNARVIQNPTLRLEFYVSPAGDWGPTLSARVKNHFASLGLARLYELEAADELRCIRNQLLVIHLSGGLAAVKADLSISYQSAEAAMRNGWRTAAYRAWAGSDWFCDGGFTGES